MPESQVFLPVLKVKAGFVRVLAGGWGGGVSGCPPALTTSLSPQDALAGGHEQHDRPLRCAGAPGLYPHVHPAPAEPHVS